MDHFTQRGINPQQQIWVQAQDIDFTAAMMCYIQMTLLHIPGEVIVGNTLTNEVRYKLYTLAHVMGNWEARLQSSNLPTNLPVSNITNTGISEIIDTETIPSQPIDEFEQIDWHKEIIFY
ncbi:hypothetical protein [Pasteurella testudinis]|uniref:hypothetical protein n=1 Tax=Pasteurella testudinis TaxID=761 RepID=UPI000A00FCD3|nr:hypothetical protein [Pasteurella testudinis]